MKLVSLWVAFFVICSVFVGMSVRADDLQNQVAGLEQTAQSTQDIIDQQKFSYLSGQWKELFLKNKFVGSIDAFLHKINLIFVVLFARDYTFSLEMLFAFMFWLFTLLSLPGYFFFIENSSLRYLAAVAGTVILAHVLIFNYLTTIAVKIVFYKSTWYWSVLTFVFIIAIVAGYLYLNRYLSKYLQAAREANKKRGLETDVKRISAYQDAQSAVLRR